MSISETIYRCLGCHFIWYKWELRSGKCPMCGDTVERK